MIQFANHGEYELDANTLDEKNKVYNMWDFYNCCQKDPIFVALLK